MPPSQGARKQKGKKKGRKSEDPMSHAVLIKKGLQVQRGGNPGLSKSIYEMIQKFQQEWTDEEIKKRLRRRKKKKKKKKRKKKKKKCHQMKTLMMTRVKVGSF